MSAEARLELDIGKGLRKAREEQHLSLRSVASSVGVSPSLLSQVETGKTQPSVGTLYALVSHLGLSLDALVHRDAPALWPDKPTRVSPAETGGNSYDAAFRTNTVQRAQDNPVIEMQNGVVWERLAVGDFALVDPLIVTYKAGASSGIDERMMRHAGIEFGCILEGELTLKLDFDTFVLRTGDSFCFRSERPHLFTNHSAAPARGVWFVIGRRDPHLQGDIITQNGDVQINSAVDVLNVMELMRPTVTEA
jgi:transcriptional regulator with XRE-family HTH domain